MAKTEYSRNYAAEHRQESTEKVQRSYRKHRAAVIARKAARRATPAGKAETAAYNRSPERRERLKEWDRQKRAADPAYVLGKRISHGIRLAIKAGKAGRRWETLVGYTLADLSAHIERQFLPGMTWANMGDWHIDHIVPQAAFSFATADDPEFRACWALTNLRPLWALDNLKKRATRPLLL